MTESGIAFCSIAYHLPERGRPPEYYVTALQDLATKVALDVVVYTNMPEVFKTRNNLRIRCLDLDGMTQRVWPQADWEALYANLARRKVSLVGAAQFECRRLIGIWLSKVGVIDEVLNDYSKVLWIDAGLPYSMLNDHRYDPHLRYSEKCLRALQRELQTWEDSVVGTRFFFPGPDLHGVKVSQMRQLNVGQVSSRFRGVAAGLLFVSSAAKESFFEEFVKIWQTLISLHLAGTEETVLTMLEWRLRFRTLSWDEWFALLFD